MSASQSGAWYVLESNIVFGLPLTLSVPVGFRRGSRLLPGRQLLLLLRAAEGPERRPLARSSVHVHRATAAVHLIRPQRYRVYL